MAGTTGTVRLRDRREEGDVAAAGLRFWDFGAHLGLASWDGLPGITPVATGKLTAKPGSTTKIP